VLDLIVLMRLKSVVTAFLLNNLVCTARWTGNSTPLLPDLKIAHFVLPY